MPHLPRRHLAATLLIAAVLASGLWAQSAATATVIHNVNLRPDPSVEYPAKRLLTPSEPPLTLLDDSLPHDGYYHVKTSQGEDGYVWSKNVHVSAVTPITTVITLGPGVPGSSSMTGCGDSLWEHVYHPSRLLVQHDCVSITGVIMDATAHQAHHQPDGVRHEPDGDTHGWLKVDPQFANLINAGNTSDEDGNLVFEIVCHYHVTQVDAVASCVGFSDTTTIPPVGTHVAIRGTLVTETNHKKWNEIHPVTSIGIQ
jgi:hypothetical protein